MLIILLAVEITTNSYKLSLTISCTDLKRCRKFNEYRENLKSSPDYPLRTSDGCNIFVSQISMVEISVLNL